MRAGRSIPALLSLGLIAGVAAGAARAEKKGEKAPLKPVEPRATLKPPVGEGYFDEVFGLDDAGAVLAVIRADGATFAKLETYDLTASPPRPTGSFDLPDKALVPVRLEVLPAGKGQVLIARTRPDDNAPVVALLIDGTGKLVAKAGPVTTFARPPGAAGLLVGFDRKTGAHGAEATYTVAPFSLATLAPAGKPHVFHTDPAGDLRPPAPPVRLIGFFDGYTRILAERAGAYDKAADVRDRPRKTILDALTGKTVSEAAIPDLLGWEVTGQLRRDHPGQSLFVDLNQDGSGVDVIDAMGKKVPAALAVPFRLYDPKSLVVEEGPAPNHLTFSLSVDPLNPDAVKRRKPDMPMLDLYSADASNGDVTLRGRVFTPRAVTYRTRADTLVVLKRFKSFARGGDELQVFDLR
ncbi:MAG TPA: hypothetical protein VHM31_23190 [Polyangia bacterium]|nr:hypothetical protein [Polyangia bacterium]